jgi:tetratricopeptide (TPR) repeat protein
MFDVLSRLTGRHTRVSVGRYQLGERLGQGACGAVFVAHDPRLERDVAIKVVVPSTVSAAEGSDRLVREAQALAKLGHPNIVEVFDVGVDTLELAHAGKPRPGVYIVMERIDGTTLGKWQAGRSIDELVDAYAQAADGLAAAHAVGVIHRDFKPANVMRRGDGRIKVLDFGLAREDVSIVGESDTDEGRDATMQSGGSESLTRTGLVMGTPRYMAPEQHTAHPATPAADQYALCVALWEALVDAPPFPGTTLDAIALAKAEGPPARPKGIDGRLHRVLARGLDPDPARRFGSVAQLATALRASRRPARRWPLVAVGALAGVAAVVVLARPAEGGVPTECEAAAATWTDAELDGADDAPTGTVPRLRRFATRWADTRAQACDGSLDTPAAARTAQLACLQRAAAFFDLARAELDAPPTRRSAKRRLWGMPSPEGCTQSDPEGLFARSDEQEAELDAIADRMRELYAQPTDPDEIAAFVQTSRARAQALHDHGIATGLLTLHARATHQRGDYEGAAQMDIDAALQCEAAGDPLLGAEHLTAAAASLTVAGAPPPEVDRIVAKALEMTEAAGDPAAVAIELGAARAFIASSRGDFDGALQLAYAAMDRAEAADSPAMRPSMARALDTAATAHINRGESYLALPLLRRALAVSVGEDNYAKEKLAFIHRGIAFAAFQTGDAESAVAAELASLDLLSQIYADDHPALLWDVAFYGYMLTELGQLDEGIAHMERARRGLLDAPRSPEISSVFANLATAWVAARRYDDAERDAALAIDRFTEQFGPNAPPVIAVHLTVAEARLAQADLAGAKAALAKAQPTTAMMAMMAGPNPGAALVSARIALAEGRHEDARADALAVIGAVDPSQLDLSSVGGRGMAFAVLAEVYAHAGDLDAARTLAEFADSLLARGALVHRRHRSALAPWRPVGSSGTDPAPG